MENLSFEQWKKWEIKIGEIKAVKDHPNADKLYVLLVETEKGKERQLVAGLKQYYKENELIGKKVVVLTNLKHAVIRGVESQGMVLAAVKDNKVVLLSPEKDIDAGAVVQ